MAQAKPKLSFVRLDKITVADRFREDFGDLESLAESFKEKGVLQPVTLSPELRLLAGERRFRAAKMAGLGEIPALIRELDGEIDAREIELMENVFRKGFEWPEECALIKEIDKLYKEKHFDWSGRKTAQLLNKGVASVSRAIQLATAIEAVPEIAEQKTADDALRVLKAMEEDVIVGELRRRQDSPEGHGLDRGIREMLKIANANYQIEDIFKGLAALRSNGVVHVIECDPPYGIDLKQLKRSKESVPSNIHSYNEIDQEGYPAFLEKLAKELFRVAGQHCWLIFWFGPSWHTQVLASLRAAGWQVDEIPCIWVKEQGQTMQPEIYLGRAYEPFFLCRKGIPTLAKRGRLNVFKFPGAQGKIHPTERPVPLMEDLLETLTTPRSIVLVPFLGSGNTLRAAYKCGMSCFGFEINPTYKDRFMLAVEQDSRTLNDEKIEGDEGE